MIAPTDAEYHTHRGCGIWQRTPPGWRCPACGRSRREVMRRVGGRWRGTLHTHHDHGANTGGFYRPELARFPETVVCDQCNTAEGYAKRSLCLPSGFSFSPAEVARFVEGAANGRHRVRLGEALKVFRGVIGGRQ